MSLFIAILARLRLPPSVQPYEILWTFSSLVGLTFQTWNFGSAYGDWRALIADGRNGARRITATNGIYNNGCAIIVHILFLMTGIVAMTQVPVSRNAPLTPTTVLVTVAIFGANAALVANAIRARVARVRLEHYLDQLEAAADSAP